MTSTLTTTSHTRPGHFRILAKIAMCPVTATQSEIARSIQCSTKTVQRHLQMPGAREEIERLRDARTCESQNSSADLEIVLSESIEGLRAIGNDIGTPAYVRVSALKAAADLARAKREDDEIIRRIEVLENES